MIMRFFGLLGVVLAVSFPAMAAEYSVDKTQSSIAFSGMHAGNVFEGVFETWDAEIRFDPDDLESSFLVATFDAASAVTGDKMYDGTLPKADWFDVENHEQPKFESASIIANEDGTYKVSGDLTIRGITNQVVFDFTVSDLSSLPVTATATIEIDRLAFDIGKKSDADAEWVSRTIDVRMRIVASR